VAKETKPRVDKKQTLDRLEIRIGRLIEVDPEPSSPKPAYRMTIDFGDRRLRSVGRFTRHPAAEMEGRLVAAVLNFGPVTIGDQVSDVLVLGVQYPKAESGEATFLTPAGDGVAVGRRVGAGAEAGDALPVVDKGEVFDSLEIRLGRVTAVEPMAEPADACRLTLDFGKLGRRQAVAPAAGLEGRLLLGVLNFAPETVGEATSEAHLLAVDATFLTPAHDAAKIGGKLF
jgi:tRNA-binding protein